MRIIHPELSAVSDTAVTVSFATHLDDGTAEARDAEILLTRADNGQRHTVTSRAEDADPRTGARVMRIPDLSPGTEYSLEIHAGNEVASDPDFLPPDFVTLTTPPGAHVATIATVSDLHFGERVCGLGPTGREEPLFYAQDEDPPYWMHVNTSIVEEINSAGVDAVIVKGDLTGEGRPDQLETAAGVLSGLEAPWHGVLGNHDVMHEGIDAFGILGQPDTSARTVEVGGVDLVLVDTVDTGVASGALPADRLSAIETELEAAADTPTLCFAHHVVDFGNDGRPTPGLRPDDSTALLEILSRHESVGGWFAGHSHSNRVRRYDRTGSMRHVEVCATKDYPTAWALYRIHEGGYLQELRRCRAPGAAGWAHRTKEMYFGLYRRYALGKLEHRCFMHRFWS